MDKNLKSRSQFFYLDLGLISYSEAYKLQTQLFELVKQRELNGAILILEHTPVITLGSNRNRSNLLASEKELKEKNIELIQSDRGGDITFHGPGQIVCYPILDLSLIKKDVSLYVYNLEEIILDVLSFYGIEGRRVPKHRGIFIENYKIASIGIRIKKWITMHGFSLNVNVDLSYFDNIVACGLKNYPQTSIEKLLNRPMPIDDVKEQILKSFGKVMKFSLTKLSSYSLD
ncbi:MAG: lipoyl(octanoyl) transferase LipB [Actinobacteria bacterium]|nr:lipoyl(octanoyl) transferase LipB [Actinomycetota bacterium]